MQDFTEGCIAGQVVRFTIPILLGNVLMSLYGTINLIWVGRLLGHEAVAAVSASLPIIMLMPAFLIGLGMATNVLIAQAFGRKDTATLRKILSNSFFSSILFCLFISLVALVFRRQLLHWIHAPREIEEMALSYLTVMMGTMVFQFFVNWMNGMLRGLGDATTVVKILILLALANILFVPLFIRGFGPLPPLGVAGAAWGTTAAAILACIVGYLYLLKINPFIDMRRWDYHFDRHIIREVFVIGIPASLQMMVVSLASVVIVTLVNRYGTHVTAAFGIGMQLDMLAIMPYVSLGMAATTIAGQNLGAQRLDRVLQALRVSLGCGLGFALLTMFLLLIFPEEIGSVFLKASADKARILHLVRDYYLWIAPTFPCMAVVFVIQGVLRSAGDTVPLLALSFTTMFVTRIPLAYLLSGTLGFRQDGIWMAIFFSGLLAVVLNCLYAAYGPWREKRLLPS